MTVVVNYGRGNLFSLSAALKHLGIAHEISDDPAVVARANRLVVPGVGAFGDAVAALQARELFAPLVAAGRRGVPFLGICVGMQMMAEAGEEFGHHQGFGLVRGTVRRLPEPMASTVNADRIPNIGWRPLVWHSRFADLPANGEGMVYFNHSFAIAEAAADEIAATFAFNGTEAVAAVAKGNMIGFQFHPERSGAVGLDLLRWAFRALT